MKKVFVFCLLMIVLNKIQAQEVPNKQGLDTIYNKVDVLPSYPGGNEGWQRYLKKNMKYPKIAWREEYEADVTMDFVVRKDGSITNIRYLTVVGYGFEEEATRLLQKCEKWKPAVKNGKVVDYHATMPISFKLKNH
jgi:protein TonB